MKNLSLKLEKHQRLLLFIFILLLFLVVYRVLSIRNAVITGRDYNLILGECGASIEGLNRDAQIHPTKYPFHALFTKINQSEQIESVILPTELRPSACDLKVLQKPYQIQPIETLARCFPNQEGISPASSVAIVLPTGPRLSQFGNADVVEESVTHIVSLIAEPFYWGKIESNFKFRWRKGRADQELTIFRVSGASSCFPQGDVPHNEYVSNRYYEWEFNELKMLSDGYIAFSYFLSKGQYQLRYKGRGTAAGGEFAKIKVNILNLNTARLAYGNYFSTSEKGDEEYIDFTADEDGHYQFQINFINDAMIEGEDRNFFLKRISLFSHPIPLGASKNQGPLGRLLYKFDQIPTFKKDVALLASFLFVLDLVLLSFGRFFTKNWLFKKTS